MPAPAALLSADSDFFTPALLTDVLAVSLTAINLLRPLYAARGGELVDFAVEYLNPAAQRMTGLGERPGGTMRSRFPDTFANGVFALYRRVFETGEVGRLDFNYQADGFDNYFQVAARRSGERLVVSFTDTADHDRTPVEVALRASQAAERAARAEAEAQRQRFYEVLLALPAQVATYHGPDHVYTFVNPCYQQYFAPQDLLGRSIRETIPEVGEQGIFALMDRVYQTGEPFDGRELDMWIDFTGTGRREQVFLNLFLYPLRDAQGRIDGLLDFSYDVTEQVRARRQAEQLNQELEVRVAERTTQLTVQQHLLSQILAQVPAAIVTLAGPEHRYTFFNALYQTLVADRAILGHPVNEVLPEVAEQGFIDLLDRVYATGQPFIGTETMLMLHDQATGQAEPRYLDFIYQPLVDGQQRTQGVLAFILDVTDRVRSRKQADTLQAAMRAVERRQVQEREELYQVFEQAPVVIAQLRGPEHFFQYRNPAFQALFPGRVLTGRFYADAMPEIVAAGLMPALDRVYATGEPYYGTALPVVTTPPDGSAPHERYYDFSYQPYREQGQTTGISVFAYDVTEQVRARRQAETLQAGLLAAVQRQARHRQDLYQVFEQTPAAIVLLREPDHRIDYFNPAFAELFPPEEWTRPLHGHTLAEVYPRLKMAGLVGLLDRVFATGEPQVVIEMPLAELQPGSPRYVTFAYQAYREEDRIVGVAAFVYEATEQVLARHEREAQQQELQRIFEQAPVPITVLRGPQLTIEIANAAIGALWGRPVAQLLGRPYFEAMPDTAGQGFEEIMAGVLHTGNPFCINEAPVTLDRAHTGQPAVGYFNFVFQSLRDAQRRPVGIVAIGTEVTDQVLARQQVQTLNEELAAINQEMQATNEELADTNHRLTRTNTDLDTFVYTASHDLKAPIANIEGLLLALRHDLPAEVLAGPLVARLLDLMQDSVARFQQTIGHLTDISQLQQADTPETVDLRALINGVRLDLAPLSEAAPATLSVTVDGCEAVRVAPKTLRSVVYNLLSNAVKYRAPERPAQVQLRAHCAAGRLVLAVHDNGLGLTTAQQAELFGMFRRLHTHVEGSGVGLFTVKRLVDNAGGTITVESQPGVGSTFTVSLPA